MVTGERTRGTYSKLLKGAVKVLNEGNYQDYPVCRQLEMQCSKKMPLSGYSRNDQHI